MPDFFRIGLLGGMFDPIHNGHLRIAVECKEALQLNELRMIPCSLPPHRDTSGVGSAQRLEMIRLAIQNVEGILVDDRELKRSGVSYTVDTLRSLNLEYPQVSFFLLIGSDAFQTLGTWREWRKILSYSNIVIARRPDNEKDQSSELGKLLEDCFVPELHAFMCSKAGKIFSLNVSQLAISSSHIRKLIREKKTTRFLFPDKVFEYVKINQLYRFP